MSETISPNTTIAQYTIVSKIGEGGMGEVWCARDPKLGRDVAIKVLPAALSADKDRLARFEQEAQAAGALNHPNILVIYHIGTHDGAPFIVSELLDGESLRERMAGNALPQRKAVDYALQLARGLAAAHEKGIVHRDIKPDNVFITDDGRVKILDFGIAKLLPRRGDGATGGVGDEDPTVARPVSPSPNHPIKTDPGTVMGTVGYMSPEQLKGQTVDHRSDIFSFGAILYEMLSGKRAFRGNSMAETMSAILREDPPDLSETNKTVSPALERVVRHCLEKNPNERFHSARDLAFAIESLSGSAISSGQNTITESVSPTTETRTGIARLLRTASVAWIVAALFALLALTGFGLWRLNRSSTTSERAVWLAFSPPPSLAFNDKKYDWAVISPDGQKIAFTAYSAEGKSMLYLADLNSPDAKPVTGTDDAIVPFWSPDSKSIAFGSLGKLKRIEIAGGNSKVICDAARLVVGTWGKTGVFVFAPDFGQPLFKVSAAGGEPEQATFREAGDGAPFPNFLPDGKHFLFTKANKGIWVGSLDSQDAKQVLTEGSNGIYANGRLLYFRNQLLVAQEFDADSLQLSGEPATIATGNKVSATGQVRISVSETGVLIYQGDWEREYQLIWFDREGKQVGAIGKPELQRTGQEPHISPDGKRLVVKRDGIWTSDLNGENAIKLGPGQLPAWSPDSSRVFFQGLFIQGKTGIYERAANGVGEPVLLLEGVKFPKAISPDGRFLLYMFRGVKTQTDVWVLPRFGDGQPFTILNGVADELESELSPDGKWLAYISDESGRYEIYVQSFTAEGKLGTDKKRISTNGGMVPNWGRDGKELFYVDGEGQMIAVAINTSGGEFQSSSQTVLFKTRMFANAWVFHEFAVSHDSQRFLVGTLIGDTKSPRPTVILNWPAALKK